MIFAFLLLLQAVSLEEITLYNKVLDEAYLNMTGKSAASADILRHAIGILSEATADTMNQGKERVQTVVQKSVEMEAIRQELDYLQEARNAETFRRNFGDSEQVVIPRVWWRYTTQRVLTLEYLDGVQIRDIDVAARPADERRALAYRMTDAWMTMIFRHGFFHGDPHPANIFVLEGDRIGLVDFGLAGSLSDEDMSRLTRLFIDAATENVAALPRRLADLGVRFPKEREGELRAAIEELYYRYYGARLSEIDPIQLIREAFALIYRMHLQLPARFVLLDRAIATLGSVGMELYPDFNVFDVAKPYARELMVERFTPQRIARRSAQETRNYARMLKELPYQIHDTMEQVRDGQIEVGFRHEGLGDLFHHMDRIANRLVIAIIAGTGVIGSALIGIFADSGPHVLGLHAFSIVGFSLSTLLGLWLAWGVIRSGRL